MARNYSTGKRDENEAALLDAARRIFGPLDVTYMREGQGFDVLIVTRCGTLIVEIKRPGRYTLTEVESDKQAAVTGVGGVYHIWQTDIDVLESFSRASAMIQVGPTRAKDWLTT